MTVMSTATLREICYNEGYFCEKDGIVYFANPADNYCLYSMNPDGTNIKKLEDQSVSYINVDDHYIYYCKLKGKSADSFFLPPGQYQQLMPAGHWRKRKTWNFRWWSVYVCFPGLEIICTICIMIPLMQPRCTKSKLMARKRAGRKTVLLYRKYRWTIYLL